MLQPAIVPSLNPSDETIGTKGLSVRFLLSGEKSNGSVAVFELVVVAGQSLPAPAHSHDHFEETIYGLEGVLTWTVDGKQIDVGPGQALCIPRGAVHRFDNNGSRDAKTLCVITPAVIDPTYFREAFAILGAGGSPDRQKMADLMRRYGLRPAAPPAN
jgi:quercetin dioxygenase-like cupin family protein